MARASGGRLVRTLDSDFVDEALDDPDANDTGLNRLLRKRRVGQEIAGPPIALGDVRGNLVQLGAADLACEKGLEALR